LKLRRRVLTIAAAVLVTAGLAGPAGAAPPKADAPTWHAGTPPLATRWTDQVGPENALPDYPRPQLTRDRWQNLNGVWQFAADTGQAVPTGQELGERVLVPYPIESALSGIQRHEDRMWYRWTFTVPAQWKVKTGNRLQLHFGAVDYDAKVYVNGHEVATHRGGGRLGDRRPDYLDGTVDQVHLYDRALSATEIQDLYDSGI
jgi:hypothetical protein